MVGLLSLTVAGLLVPSASYFAAGYCSAGYCSTGKDPTDLDALREADLAAAPEYIAGTGLPSTSALSFRRHGARGEFHLTRLEGRDDLWLLLRAPEWRANEIQALGGYVPPSHFEGRLLRLADATFTDRPLRALIAREGGDPERGYLLLEGDTPRQHRTSLVALVLLALIGIGCLSLTARLLSVAAPRISSRPEAPQDASTHSLS